MSVEELQPSELPEPPSPATEAGGTIVRVSAILPAGYDVYLRLFHPFVDWGAQRNDATEPRATWQQIARQAGVPFGPNLTWRQLEPVLREGDRHRYALPVGELPGAAASALIEALTPGADEAPVYFEYRLAGAIVFKAPLAFRAPLGEFEAVRDLVRMRNGGAPVAGPELVWPEDRRWIVCSDYDLSSTYIACDETTARSIELRPDLEVIRVSQSTRIDDAADLGG